jgi:hypothetical protein
LPFDFTFDGDLNNFETISSRTPKDLNIKEKSVRIPSAERFSSEEFDPRLRIALHSEKNA